MAKVVSVCVYSVLRFEQPRSGMTSDNPHLVLEQFTVYCVYTDVVKAKVQPQRHTLLLDSSSSFASIEKSKNSSALQSEL